MTLHADIIENIMNEITTVYINSYCIKENKNIVKVTRLPSSVAAAAKTLRQNERDDVKQLTSKVHKTPAIIRVLEK